MAIGYVQSKGLQSTGYVDTMGVTFTSSVTAGNYIVACCQTYNADSPAAPTVSDGRNSYSTPFSVLQGGATGYRQTQHIALVIANEPITVTFNGPTANDMMTASISEVSVASGKLLQYEVSSYATGGSAAASSGDMPAAGSAIFIGGVTHDGSGTYVITPSGGYTQIFEDEDTGEIPANFEYLLSTGTKAATWDITSVTWYAFGAAYKEADPQPAILQKYPTDNTCQRATSGTSVSGTFASSVTAGNVVVAVVSVARGSGSGEIPTVSDNKGNTWKVTADAWYGGTHRVVLAYAVATVGGSSFQVTATTVANHTFDMALYELQDLKPIDPVSWVASANSASTTTPAGPRITTVTDGYVFAALCRDATASTITGTWGTELNEDESTSYPTLSVCGQACLAGTEQQPNWTCSVAGTTSSLIVAFNAVNAPTTIELVGASSTPEDYSAAVQAGPTVAVVPPADCKLGDLVLIHSQYRGTSAPTTTISNTGGQTWTALTAYNGTNVYCRWFWCIFDGTWDANPSVTITTGSLAMTETMYVFRNVNTSTPFDVAQTVGTFAAPASPYDVSLASITTTSNYACAVFSWASADDNTWWLQTANWSTAGNAQNRNTTGSDQSSCEACRTLATAGATGAVLNRQLTLAADAGAWSKFALKWGGTLVSNSVTSSIAAQGLISKSVVSSVCALGLLLLSHSSSVESTQAISKSVASSVAATQGVSSSVSSSIAADQCVSSSVPSSVGATQAVSSSVTSSIAGYSGAVQVNGYFARRYFAPCYFASRYWADGITFGETNIANEVTTSLAALQWVPSSVASSTEAKGLLETARASSIEATQAVSSSVASSLGAIQEVHASVPTSVAALQVIQSSVATSISALQGGGVLAERTTSIEALQAVASAVPTSTEALGTLAFSRTSSIGSLQEISSSVASSVGALQAISNSVATSWESKSIAVAFHDYFASRYFAPRYFATRYWATVVGTEELTPVTKSVPSSIEAKGVVAFSRATSIGATQAISSAATSSVEAQKSIASSVATSIGSLQTVSSAAASSLEAKGVVDFSRASSLEALQAISSALATSLEASQAISKEIPTSWESGGLVPVSSDVTTSIEALQAATSSVPSSLAALQALASAIASSVESVQGISSSIPTSDEALQALGCPVASSVEAVQAISSSRTSNVEAVQGILMGVSTSTEALKKLLCSVSTSWESKGSLEIARAITTSLEAQGVLFVPKPSSIEAQCQLYVSHATSDAALQAIGSAVPSGVEALGLLLIGESSSLESTQEVSASYATALAAVQGIQAARTTSDEAMGLLQVSRTTGIQVGILYYQIIQTLTQIEFELQREHSVSFEIPGEVSILFEV